MSEDINPLRDMRSAIENENEWRVTQLTSKVQSLFDQRRDRERGYDRIAKLLRQNDQSDVAQSAGTEYLNAVATAESLRGGVNTTILSYINGDTTSSSAKDLIQSSIEAETALNKGIENIRNAIDDRDVSVPKILIIIGPKNLEFPKGLDRDYTYTIKNIGGKKASNVKINIEERSDINITPTNFESIMAGSEKNIEVTGELTNTGISTNELAIVSGQYKDSIELRVTVGSPLDYLEAAKKGVKKLKKSTAETDAPPGLVAKLEQTIEKLNRAIQMLERGAKGGITGQINASINLLNAYLNQLDALNGKRVEPNRAAQLRIDTDGIISNIKIAREIHEEGPEDTGEDNQKGGTGRGQD